LEAECTSKIELVDWRGFDAIPEFMMEHWIEKKNFTFREIVEFVIRRSADAAWGKRVAGSPGLGGGREGYR
jgi:hypothetical protein